MPEAPGAVRLIGISDESVTIEWSAPVNTGGAHITSYVIEKREVRRGNDVWQNVATVTGRTTSYRIQYLNVSTTGNTGLCDG